MLLGSTVATQFDFTDQVVDISLAALPIALRSRASLQKNPITKFADILITRTTDGLGADRTTTTGGMSRNTAWKRAINVSEALNNLNETIRQ